MNEVLDVLMSNVSYFLPTVPAIATTRGHQLVQTHGKRALLSSLKSNLQYKLHLVIFVLIATIHYYRDDTKTQNKRSEMTRPPRGSMKQRGNKNIDKQHTSNYRVCFIQHSLHVSTGEGVHDLRIDEGLPSASQKATPF